MVTADSPETAGRVLAKEAGLPVFYPLIGIDDEETAGMARKIKK
jgi:adenylyl- and sulfurtransferase ThiI